MTEEQTRLVTENLRLAGYIANKYMHSGIEYDDLTSACYLGLTKAARTFDPGRGVNFSTYSARCMEQEIWMLLRARKKHGCVCMSLDAPISEESKATLECFLATDGDIFDGLEDADLIDSIRRAPVLKEAERAVVLLYLQNMTQRAIATQVGRSQSIVSRIIKRAVRKLYVAGYLNGGG